MCVNYGDTEMRNFAIEAVAGYLGAIGMVAVFAGVVGLSAALMEANADVAVHETPVSTAVAWQTQ